MAKGGIVAMAGAIQNTARWFVTIKIILKIESRLTNHASAPRITFP